jgi:glutathione S-transferase
MDDLILHHYASSPFSEKVRLVLGMKGLHWKSVTVPVMMPKPDVVALTGGYRRTPFMQIGADIWCDTALMCRVIERLEPTPTLYPPELGGLAPVLAQWADSVLFWVAVPLTIQLGGPTGIFPNVTPEFLKAFGADRAAMSAGVRRPGPHDARAHLLNYLGWLEQQLGDGRPFMLGSLVCIADFAIVQSLWFMQLSAKVGELLQPHARLREWYVRMVAHGHGTQQDLSSSDALAVAAAAVRHAPCEFDATLGLERGAAVAVNALDYAADPVAGRLVGLSLDETVIERVDERAGKVHVHFPRIGYQIKVEKTQ